MFLYVFYSLDLTLTITAGTEAPTYPTDAAPPGVLVGVHKFISDRVRLAIAC